MYVHTSTLNHFSGGILLVYYRKQWVNEWKKTDLLTQTVKV